MSLSILTHSSLQKPSHPPLWPGEKMSIHRIQAEGQSFLFTSLWCSRSALQPTRTWTMSSLLSSSASSTLSLHRLVLAKVVLFVMSYAMMTAWTRSSKSIPSIYFALILESQFMQISHTIETIKIFWQNLQLHRCVLVYFHSFHHFDIFSYCWQGGDGNISTGQSETSITNNYWPMKSH